MRRSPKLPLLLCPPSPSSRFRFNFASFLLSPLLLHSGFSIRALFLNPPTLSTPLSLFSLVSFCVSRIHLLLQHSVLGSLLFPFLFVTVLLLLPLDCSTCSAEGDGFFDGFLESPRSPAQHWSLDG